MKREYRIYSKSPIDGEVEEVERFESESREDAINKTKEYRNRSEDGKKYYWDYVIEHVQLGKDGEEIARAESIEELHEELRKMETKTERFCLFFRALFRRISDKYYKVKYAFQRMFRGYDDIDSFSISDGIIDFITYNIPIMIRNLHGCPQRYCDKAQEIVDSAKDVKFDAYPQKNNLTMEIAMALWRNRLENILQCARLYKYYSSYGIQSIDDSDWLNPNDYPIPIVECTEFMIDYEKLHRLGEEAKDEMFNYIREDFDTLWD